jgi:hypothetical protein
MSRSSSRSKKSEAGRSGRKKEKEPQSVAGQQKQQTLVAGRGDLSKASHVWILQAKSWEVDKREKEASTFKAFLVPGVEYRLGKKPSENDFVVLGDKTVSGKHALLSVVVSEDGLSSRVVIRDLSKLGTIVASTSADLANKTGTKVVRESVAVDHGGFILFGLLSPFQVRRAKCAVCLHASLEHDDEAVDVVNETGFNRVDMPEEVPEGVIFCLVVRESTVLLDDDIILAVNMGVPIVTLDWLKAWRLAPWIGSGPKVDEYAVSIVYGEDRRDSLEPRVSDTGLVGYRVQDNISNGLDGYVFVWPRVGGDQFPEKLARAADLAGVRVMTVSPEEDMSSLLMSVENPVVILEACPDVSASFSSLGLPNDERYSYCLLDDLRRMLLDGLASDRIKPLFQTRQNDAPEGWHVVQREGNDEVVDSEDDDMTQDETFVIPVVTKPVRAKGFVKKHKIDANRPTIDLVVSEIPKNMDDEEWVEREREKMNEKLKQDAFDKQGTAKAMKARKRVRK